MTVHIVGTSHVLAMGRSLSILDKSGSLPDFKFYYANNSAYSNGTFEWRNGQLSHSFPEITESWRKSCGESAVAVSDGDIIVGFGFDDFDGRYQFLTEPPRTISSACRADLVADVALNSNLAGLLNAIQGRCDRVIVVDPPLFSRELQARKSGSRLVDERRFEEAKMKLQTILAEHGAVHVEQPIETIDRNGVGVFTRSEYVAADGFHWSDAGIESVRRSLLNAISELVQSVNVPEGSA